MSQVASSRVAARLASLSAAPRRRDARASRAPATKSRRGAHIVLDASPGGSPPAAVDAVVFTVIVDDLVFPDGTTKMCVMGGGGPQTAFGLRAHPSDLTVGIAAGVGSDLPSECASWLDANAVDTTGLALVRDRAADVDASDAADRWEGGGADPSDFLPRDHPPPPAISPRLERGKSPSSTVAGRKSGAPNPPPHSTPCSAHRHPHSHPRTLPRVRSTSASTPSDPTSTSSPPSERRTPPP